MATKRKLTDKQLKHCAQLSDSDPEWEDIVGESYNSQNESLSLTKLFDESDVDSDKSVDGGRDEIDIDNRNSTSAITLNENVDEEDSLWTDTLQDPPNFTFNENSGCKIDCADFEIDKLVDLFFSDDFLIMLVDRTNLNASQAITKSDLSQRTYRMSRWRETDISEMKIFIALLLYMGPCSFPTIEHYWSESYFYYTEFSRTFMSRNRFRSLLRFVCFDDNAVEVDDLLYKIRPVLNHFNHIMNVTYVPERNLRIDESMLLWHERLYFTQYMKNKKYRHGVKLYELCQLNGLVMKLAIYCGRSKEIDRSISHSTEVVLHLMENSLDKGHVLYLSNFYNSVRLTNLLSERRTYVCGMLSSDREDNPKSVVKKNLKKGECTWKRNNTAIVCKWKGERDLLAVTNMHKVKMVEVRNSNRRISLKPNILKDYNAATRRKRVDRVRTYYSALRETIDWPMKIGIHIFEIYIQNAYILYREATGSMMECLRFREKFIECLLGSKSSDTGRRSKSEEVLHYLETIEPSDKKLRPTKPCRVCTRKKVRRETRYYCAACNERPALCVQKCFKEYHSERPVN